MNKKVSLYTKLTFSSAPCDCSRDLISLCFCFENNIKALDRNNQRISKGLGTTLTPGVEIYPFTS